MLWSMFLALFFISAMHSNQLSDAEQKAGVDTGGGFFSLGQKKKLKDVSAKLQNSVLKSKVEVLGEVLKKHIDSLRNAEKSQKLEMVFLVDASSSVGEANFDSELKFVKKLLADFTVSSEHTRVAIVTFSSIGQVVREIDQIGKPSHEHHKCGILQHAVQYTGGGTYTLGAMLEAQAIFSHSRPSARKVLFLITDGFSNGGDPRKVASELRADGVTIFTFGVQNGNTEELFEMASKPGEEHSYILESFAEFVALARRALHTDLAVGIYVEVSNTSLCPEKCGYGAACACGLRTGQYACLCPPGYYGLGTADQQHPCLPCPNGTYHDGNVPGDVTMCTPCPDVNHMTNVPATGLNDCMCKSGFTANGTTCQMVRCPRLKAPEHGYFVRSSCNNVVNAACGMRCDVGYSLVGSSVRLCQQDGTWSGSSAKCRVKRCTRPQTPLNGSVSCIPHRRIHEDFPVDTECHFSCQPGNYLVGSKLRTCLPLARWDGLPASCKPILCPPLPKISNGYWEPEQCTERKKHSYGSQCFTKCLPGYELKGPKQRECGGKGSWTNRKEPIKCIDVTPPTIECPDNIETYTDNGTSYATVEWIVPEPRDNSNVSVLVWSRPATEIPMKVRFGVTNISYIATDASYNQAVCHFSITVLDGEPPAVEDCESPPAFYKSTNWSNKIKWSEPQFHDNSMEPVDVKKSHDFGEFPVGTTQVTYIATDHSGNNASCVINITVKEEEECSDIPAHTIVNCSQGLCSVKCEDGYEFAAPNNTFDEKYHCENLTEIVPDCSETELPNSISQKGTLTLDPAPPEVCSNMSLLNQISSELLNKLQDVCNESDEEACGVNDTVSAECEHILSTLEEETNKLATKRRRRETSHDKLNLHFTLVGKSGLKHAQHRLSSMAKENTLFKNVLSDKPFSLDLKPVKVICPPATVRRKHKCVKCPAGTYWNSEKFLCSPCPLGTYQPLMGQRECLACPLHTSTRRLHSRRLNQCRAICPPGTYSTAKGRKLVGRVGVKPCSSCPIGWYQPQAGSVSCLQCESNKTTQTRGSVSARQCFSYEDEVSPCHSSPCKNSGICQHLNGLITCVCPPGYLGSFCESMINECDSVPCLHGGTCMQNGTKHACTCPDGYAGTDCQDDVDECASNPCLNNGECIDLVASFQCHCPSTHQGDICEENIDDCIDNPCGDGNTCIDGLGAYTCSCREGYSGKYCEIDPCSNTSICQNNGTCYLHNNISQPSYWCECLPTFNGTHCEIKLNPCDSSPCRNNGSCVQKPGSLEFDCICVQGYIGVTCDTVSNLNFTLHFVTSGTTNYVRLQGPHKPLNQVSVCLWMKTHDRLNYGTVFSYATPNHDNSLTLTDYNGLVIYVNGERVVTDVTANDGVWHHICIEWITDHGQWALYKDGILSDAGVGLASNTVIPGGGMLILGQDQDRVGGGFSASESLIGHLTQVDFWDYNLGSDEINSLATLCGVHNIGNLINWGQFYFGIHGRIRIRETTLCRGCKNLSPLPFTNITIMESENVAVYTCEPGYAIQQGLHEVLTLKRKCLVHGNWEGPTPICERRSCGFPGYFTLGQIIGQSYLFGDHVKYECYPGYRLIGTTMRQCQADGTWSGITPSCQGGECPDLFLPEHGTMWSLTNVDAESNSYQMEFECKRGYELQGKSVLTCLPNKTWDSDLPVCKPVMCLAPDKLPHTVFELVNNVDSVLTNETKFPVGTEIRHACENGFKVETQGGTLICEENGHWHAKSNNSVISCSRIPTCLPPEDVPNGNLSYISTLLPGTTVNLVCNKGFKVNGNDTQVCLDNGTWSDELGMCERIICHSVNTSLLQIPESNAGESVTIRCPSGYQLTVTDEIVESGESRWQCNEDGSWEEEDDRNTTANIWNCKQYEPIQCSHPEGPPYGYVVFKESNKTTHSEGSYVEIQCRQGYELVGDNRTYCQSDGTWSNSTVCKAVECGPPPLPRSTELAMLSSTQYGSMAKLKCLPGYHSFGDMSIRCQANKKWSRIRGRCIRMSCGKPVIKEGMVLTGHSYLFNDSQAISCPSGTILVGPKTITCGKDGKWSDLPDCVKKQ